MPGQRPDTRFGTVQAQSLAAGVAWEDLFPGAAAVEISAEGAGTSLSLRITKKEGVPVRLVPEGTAGESVVAVRRVNELDFYNLGHRQVAEKSKLTGPKLTALIRVYGLDADTEYCKEIKIGGTTFKRYSQKVLPRIAEILQSESIEDIWRRSGMGARAAR
jgi:hypothetical protein